MRFYGSAPEIRTVKDKNENSNRHICDYRSCTEAYKLQTKISINHDKSLASAEAKITEAVSLRNEHL